RRLSFSANDSVRKPNAAQCHLLHRTAGHQTPKNLQTLHDAEMFGKYWKWKDYSSPLGPKDRPQEWNSERNGKEASVAYSWVSSSATVLVRLFFILLLMNGKR
ncbi:hypothetical protein CDAR_590811, partial [Caerostris darwini]